MNRCLCCYKPLKTGEIDMHKSCVRKFFGTDCLPSLDYTIEALDQLAEQVIRDQTSLTGVQPKLSLNLENHEGSKRLTIVGLWGGYICKPQTSLYRQMPEMEDLTMHLAEICHISVVPHALMRMGDNTLCYLSRRLDRTSRGEKIVMEDMCQITERQTEYKYRSSYERIGKAIVMHSSLPRLDVVNFFEVVLFSWITGNNDMHLKNFSLWEAFDGEFRLTPSYDLLGAAVISPADNEELALSLNGKKNRLTREDFIAAARTMGIEEKVVSKMIAKYKKLLPEMISFINISFLDDDLKEKYIALVESRTGRIS